MGDEPTRQMTIDYDDSGRIYSRTRITFGVGDDKDSRFSYQPIRDGRGMTIGMRFDMDGDEIYEEKEYWDISCWAIQADGVFASKPIEKRPVSSQAPTPMTQKLNGRWETEGKRKIRISFDFEAGRIRLSQNNKNEAQSPLKVVSRHVRAGAKCASALDVKFQVEGEDRIVTVRPLFDDVIVVEFDGEGPWLILSRTI
ncbi:MAG: hypothetical protein ACI9OJ_002004 [Myxococcota bacterium]